MQHVAVDQRLGELLVQRVQEPALARHVAGGVDDVVGAAEVGEFLADVAQMRLRLGKFVAGKAHRVLARLVGELVHQRA